jgi:hypothetical protein
MGVLTDSVAARREGTFQVARIHGKKPKNTAKRARERTRRRSRKIQIGAPDPRLTPAAGVAAIQEVDRVAGLTAALDRAVGPIKKRNRGSSGGQAVVAAASAIMAGADCLSGLDRRREDGAARPLEPAPALPSTTFGGLARRFGPAQVAGIEAGLGEANRRVVDLLPGTRRSALLRHVTLDGDGTDIEVYGRRKDAAERSYTGGLTIRSHIMFWAELGVPVAADLLGGADDPRDGMVELLDRALASLPDGVKEVSCRWDAGYFADELARACLDRRVRFAIGAKRVGPVMAAGQQRGLAWVPAIGMEHTEVAEVDYLPGPWPKDAQIRCIARRTRIPLALIPSSRARKHRTIPKNQLELALDGKVEGVWGYSFILTDIPLPDRGADPDAWAEKIADVEHWYRHRTDIEALNKDAKHGAAMRHMPSGHHPVNQVWMWACLVACAIGAWIQELARLDAGNGRGRRTLARLCRELIRVPGRVVRGQRAIRLRLPPGPQLLAVVLPRLQSLPSG